jgi:tetratricopeptide (TPR) repeat protein
MRALVERFGAGDRAWLAGDYRTALFAYQDATYLDPTSAAARIRLARAYQALRHEDLARQQLTLALELDPENAEARRLLEGLKAPPATGASQAGSSATPAGAPAEGGAQKVYKLTEDPDAASPPGARPPEPKAPEPVRPAPPQPR